MFLTENFTLARMASDFKFSLTNRKFHSPWRVWRVLFPPLYMYIYLFKYYKQIINKIIYNYQAPVHMLKCNSISIYTQSTLLFKSTQRLFNALNITNFLYMCGRLTKIIPDHVKAYNKMTFGSKS